MSLLWHEFLGVNAYASIVFHLLTNTRTASSYAADILRPEDNRDVFILGSKITMSNRLVSPEFQYQGDIAKKNVGWLVDYGDPTGVKGPTLSTSQLV